MNKSPPLPHKQSWKKYQRYDNGFNKESIPTRCSHKCNRGDINREGRDKYPFLGKSVLKIRQHVSSLQNSQREFSSIIENPDSHRRSGL